MDIILITIKDWMWGFGFWGQSLAIILSLVAVLHSGPVLKSQATRNRWQHWLAEDTIGNSYRRLMTNLLDWVDRKLSYSSDAPINAPRRAWSPGVLNLTLVLAVAYPMLAMFTQWMFGGTGKIGTMVAINPATFEVRRMVFAWLAITLIGFWLSKKSKTNSRFGYLFIALIVLAGTIFFRNTLGAFVIVLAMAFLGLFAIRGAISGAFTIAFTSTFAVIFTLTFERVAQITKEVARNTFSSFPPSLLLDVSVGVAIFIAAILAGIIAQSALLLKPNVKSGGKDKSMFLWMFFLAAYFGASTAFLLRFQDFSSGGQNAQPASVLVLFLVIFPIFNALADFLSIGLTRWRLRTGLESSGFLGKEAIQDTIGAVIIFAILGISLIMYGTIITQNGGVSLLNLSGFFYDLRHFPENHIWLAFMLVSTLLPTLLHLIIASLSFFMIFPVRVRDWASKGLGLVQKDGDAQLGLFGQLGLSAMIVLAIWVPVNLFFYGFTYHGIVTGWIIDGFSEFHRWIA